jgi:TolB-like protein/Tfp pilus assembly protein PilF
MIGRTLSHYEITAKLGEGGMGEVWRATDTSLNREVAVKVLPAEMAADPERLERFKREAKSLAALNHPNVVTIHSVEEVEGLHLLTMELVEGDSLDQVLPAQGFGLDRLFPLAIQVADALAAAHEKVIIHRDLKPANVMVGEGGHVKVLDFGLAKLAASEPKDEETQLMTQDGMILGTVLYMSPEQIQSQPVDARSDIFSLGILLYEMATGERPFQGENTPSVISAVLKDQPQPVTELKADLPNHLGRIVHRCLEKDPDRRYQSAKDVRNELEGLRDELRSAALRVGSGPKRAAAATVDSRRSGSRNAWLRPAAIGALVLALGGAAWWFGSSRRTAAPVGDAARAVEASIAVLPFASVSTDEASLAFSSGIHNDLVIRLSKVGALKVISRTSVMEYRETTKNLRQIADELGVATVLEGSVQRSGDRVRLNTQLVNAANDETIWAEAYDRELTVADIFDIQEDVAGKIATALQARLTPEEQQQLERRPTENLEAWEAYQLGLDYADRAEEASAHRLAVQMFERAVDLDPEFALAHAHLGRQSAGLYHQFMDHTQERLDSARQAIETALRLEPGLPEARMARGYYYYWGQLDYERALAEFAAAAEAQPSNPQILTGIGFVRRRQGRFEEALEMFERAAEVNPRGLEGLEARAWTNYFRRNDDAAERLYEDLLQRNPASGNGYEASAMLKIQARGDVAAARQVIQRSDELTLASPELDMAAIQISMMAGDYADALRRIEAIGGETVVDNQFDYWPKELVIAWVHDLAGDAEAARSSFEAARRVLEQRERELPGDERVASALGRAYAGLGRKQEAIRQGLRGTELLPVEREAVRGAARIRDLAAIYATVGEPELAIGRLEFLLSRPGRLSAPYLKVEPTWIPLRDHPDFRRLVGG